MTARRPEYVRPFSAEYQHASGRPVTQDGPTKRCVIFSAGILEGEPPI
jgi:hypothetical protein